jgi:class 3 adenylate cyclase
MSARRSSLCVLFADISDSTQLYEALGDEWGRRLVLECFEEIEQTVERLGGTHIDRVGDEILCTFPDAASAGRASCELHRVLEATNPDRPAEMSIRIGFHYGPILLDGDHIFGDTIHVARRVTSLAKAQQTLTTGQTVELIAPTEQLVIRFVDRTPLKGKTDTFEIFEIVWDEGAATANAESLDAEEAVHASRDVLDLGTEDGAFVLDATTPVVTIGRDPRADLVFDHEKVSRLHARIEQRRDRFVIVDQSMNGSKVIESDGRRRFVRRDEYVLGRAGTIVLGPGDPQDGFPCIHFERRSRLSD